MRENNKTNAVDLNVGGMEITVGRDTLMSVEGSLMRDYFSGNAYLKRLRGNHVFLDRDPDLFVNILKYLRSERKWYPKDMSADFQANLNLEIKRWRLDAGLDSIQQMTKPE